MDRPRVVSGSVDRRWCVYALIDDDNVTPQWR